MFEGFDFGAVLTAAGLAKLGQIIIGDLTMAGDNVVIMGSLASGLPPRDRKKVLLFGVGMALVCLITFAVIATQLLRVTGLVFAGGLLLLWVAYNMWTELRPRSPVIVDDPDTEAVEGPRASKTLLQAAIGIAIADLSMSLDNVLLVEQATLTKMWVLRRILMQMGTVDAMQFLLDKMKDAKSNEDFFASMNQ